MPFSLCIVPVAPVRAEAAHKSEQISQMLFGEVCEVLESDNDFLYVRTVHDNYKGWCQANQLEPGTEPDIQAEEEIMAGEWVNLFHFKGEEMRVPFGSSLSVMQSPGIKAKYKFDFNGKVIYPETTPITEALIKEYTTQFLNTPYLWGGRSVFGIDCSGFSQLVYKCLNVPLLRDAYQQATQGESIGFLQEAKCGDLAFFDNEAGRITHVGILLSANSIIHASGRVRIDTMDNLGIVNKETGKRTHNLRVIKRVLKYNSF